MKKVRISTTSIGLVFKKENYLRVITEGVHWLAINETVDVYDLTKEFKPDVELNILLRDEHLAEQLHVIEVKDHEIVILWINSNFNRILTPGRHAFWKGVINYTFTMIDLSKIEITEDIPLNLMMRPELLQYIRVYVVESYEKGILFVNGNAEKLLETGIYHFWKNPVALVVLKCDLRQQQLEVSGQEILTKDKAPLRVNFFTYYKTVDIEKALRDNKDFEKQLYVIMQLALREFVGTLTLDEILEKKETASTVINEMVQEKARALGVELMGCGIRDIILPGEMKDIMNQVLIAEKKAQANIIMRREETASTRSLLNTAKLMEENAMLFRLKEMEYVEKIAEKINTLSLSGGNHVLDQLKELFSPNK